MVAVPWPLANTASNWAPLSPEPAVAVYVVDVAPPMGAHVSPASFERCHWTVGTGLPEAAAVNEYVAPAAAVTGVGWVVTSGGNVTDSVAAAVVAVPDPFVNTARNRVPSSPGAALAP